VPKASAPKAAPVITANTVANESNGVILTPDLDPAQAEPVPVEKLVPDFPDPSHSEPASKAAVLPAPMKTLVASLPTNSATMAATTAPTTKTVPAPVQPALTPAPPAPAPVVAVSPQASAGPLLPGAKVLARELTPSKPEATASVATEAAISVPATAGRPNLYWLGCAAAAGLAVALFLVFARKHRAPEPISLITRSLERERK
jgi:hypothetical protein